MPREAAVLEAGRRLRAGDQSRRAPRPPRQAPLRVADVALLYAAPCGIPSVSMQEPSFHPRWDRFRCWRGPSWMNTAWLLVPALRELGYDDRAAEIVASLQRAVARDGLREYYDPLTGAGLGARGFGWSALLIDL